MRRLPLLLCLAGCTLEPSYLGPWEITLVDRGGVVQKDVGFVELQEDGPTAYWFFRYDFADGAFEPITTPVVRTGTYSTQRFEGDGQYQFDGYYNKGETYAISFANFGAIADDQVEGAWSLVAFEVVDYDQRHLDLQADAAGWFGDPVLLGSATPEELAQPMLPMRILLRR